MSRKLPDISKELLIYRFGHGIQLIKPEQEKRFNLNPAFCNTGHTVLSMMSSPMSVYFLSALGEGQSINDIGLAQCGIQSKQDALGKTIESFADKETARHALSNTKRIISTARTEFFDEDVIYNTGEIVQSLAIKVPWYNENNKIIGIIGYSIQLGTSLMTNSLAYLQSLGLLEYAGTIHQPSLPHFNKNVYLSPRETECLRLYAQGKTAKQSAKILNISYRTFENYIQNIKSKLGVSSKYDLMLIAQQYNT